MIVFDATTPLCLLDPEAEAPAAPETGEPVTRVQERVEFLVRELESAKEKIIVPPMPKIRLTASTHRSGSRTADSSTSC